MLSLQYLQGLKVNQESTSSWKMSSVIEATNPASDKIPEPTQAVSGTRISEDSTTYAKVSCDAAAAAKPMENIPDPERPANPTVGASNTASACIALNSTEPDKNLNSCADDVADSAVPVQVADACDVTRSPTVIVDITRTDGSAPNSAGCAEVSQSASEVDTDKISPYAYTARGEFTSENFKIEIRNMPRYYGVAQFKKFLQNTLKLRVHKLKPLPGRGAGLFVTLHDEAGRQEALRLLDGREWKKARLTARPAAAVPDPLLAGRQKRRQQDAATDGGDAKRPRPDAPPLEQRARDAVVPWWNVPYDEQLRRKHVHLQGVLADYKKALRKQNFPLFRWLEKDGHCAVEPVRPSPETERYRNKCEFSVGFHPETGERVVGFRLASYREGSMAVAPLDGQTQIPDRMRQAALLFQQHVRESEYAPFNAVTHEGHWRQLMVRTTRGGDLLLSAQFHPQQLTAEQVAAAQDALRRFMTEGAGAACGATAVFWQTGGPLRAGAERPHQLLAGADHVTETLSGLRLQISPAAFFQVNTAAAEVLYDAVAECAALDAETTLLDVCCGAGSIGLTLASRAGAVIGLELVETAVADARRNADRNGITNCEFLAGRAETLLRVVLERGEAARGRTVAVVDPPRAGLGREVTQALRRAETVRRVVYVACDLRQSLRNLLDLARPESNQYAGYPFVVRRLVPVDLFPQTPHIEVAVLLERCDPELWRQTEEAKVPAAAAGEQEGAEAEARDTREVDGRAECDDKHEVRDPEKAPEPRNNQDLEQVQKPSGGSGPENVQQRSDDKAPAIMDT